MTLGEAIKHAEEVAEEKFNNAVYIMDKMKSAVALENAEECKRCADEHRQLAEWLAELAERRKADPEWIPCSERLPEEDVEVLVTDDAGGMATIEKDMCGTYENTGERFWYTSQNVTAWMPLPKTYKKE